MSSLPWSEAASSEDWATDIEVAAKDPVEESDAKTYANRVGF